MTRSLDHRLPVLIRAGRVTRALLPNGLTLGPSRKMSRRWRIGTALHQRSGLDSVAGLMPVHSRDGLRPDGDNKVVPYHDLVYRALITGSGWREALN